MSTTTVRLTAESAGYAKWHVWLVDGKGPAGARHGIAVVPRSIAHGQLSTSGVALVTLDPTSELLPAGMVYRVDFRPVASSTPEQMWFEVPVSAETVDAASYEVDPPAEVTFIYDGGGAATFGVLEDGGGAVAA